MKRTIVSLVLAVVFTLSATVFAVLPTQNSAPAPVEGETLAALTDIGLPFVLAGDECPGASDTGQGCGG